MNTTPRGISEILLSLVELQVINFIETKREHLDL
jgi:hypothetical protein